MIATNLDKALEFLNRLDQWLCLPAGCKRSNMATLENALSKMLLLPPDVYDRWETSPYLPYLKDATALRLLENNVADIADPLFRVRVIHSYIQFKTGYPSQVVQALANTFVMMEC